MNERINNSDEILKLLDEVITQFFLIVNNI